MRNLAVVNLEHLNQSLMRTLYFAFFLILISFSPRESMAYDPFLKNTSFFIEHFGGLGSLFHWYIQDGDSTYNGQIYKKYRNDTLGVVHLVREDTILKQVWWIKHSGTTERILYDFGLQVGGSWSFYGSYGTLYNYEVVLIDTITSGSKDYRRFLFKDPNSPFGFNVSILEGVGSMDEPFLILNEGSSPVYSINCTFSGPNKEYSGGSHSYCLPPPNPGDLSVTLERSKDNTLYEDSNGALSNGSGSYIFSGSNDLYEKRRAVLAFDIAGSIPAGSIIESAHFSLDHAALNSNPQPVALHRLLSDWGEGSSNAPGNEEGGVASTSNDATWIHTNYDSVFWSNPGADFDQNPSATEMVSGNGYYNWTSEDLTDDVQFFLDFPGQNFGWILIGEESDSSTVKRFRSREQFTPFPIGIHINYRLPCPNDSVIITVPDSQLTAYQTNATYQWIDCQTNQPIPGASQQSFFPDSMGSFAVILNMNGCTDTSDCILVNPLGLHLSTEGFELKVHPNPAHDKIWVSSDGKIVGELELSLINANGKLIQTFQSNLENGMIQIDLSGLDISNGYYVLTAKTNRGNKAIPIVLSK